MEEIHFRVCHVLAISPHDKVRLNYVEMRYACFFSNISLNISRKTLRLEKNGDLPSRFPLLN